MHVEIHIAGISRELEKRIALACGLLAADQLQADMHPWKGRACDVLVVDMQSGYGRSAYDVARRKSFPILGFGAEGSWNAASGICQLDHHVPVAIIAKALRGMLLRSAPPAEASATGLLDACMRETGGTADLHAAHGPVAVIIRPVAGRIHARTVSDLLAAEARLLNPGWLTTLALQPQWDDADWHISRSLDSFFVLACRRFQSRLPILEQRSFKLRRWPDLGSIPDDVDSLRLATLFHRSAWTVQDLAQHTGLDAVGINAFCWAALAGGALASTELPVPAPVAGRTHHAASSMLQRVARHFGVRLGHGHLRA